MASRYRPNPVVKLNVAPQLAAAGRSVIPHIRNASRDLTGHYDRSLRVVNEDGQVRLESTDIAAHLIEFGSVNNAPQAPMRRGFRAAGFKFYDV
jgi:hypothetical protein